MKTKEKHNILDVWKFIGLNRTYADSISINKSTKSKLKSELYEILIKFLTFQGNIGSAAHSIGWWFFLLKFNSLSLFLINRSSNYFKNQDLVQQHITCIRDLGLIYERIALLGKAEEMFKIALNLSRSNNLQGLESEIIKKINTYNYSSENDQVYLDNSFSYSLNYDLSSFQFEEFYKLSDLFNTPKNPSKSINTILKTMITATNSQYGAVFLEQNTSIPLKKFVINFLGDNISEEELSINRNAVDTLTKNKSLLIDNDFKKNISLICAPLLSETQYFGFVYLTNHNSTGLYNEITEKSVQILSTQISLLINYSTIMANFESLNNNLSNIVKNQTKDLKEKNKIFRKQNGELTKNQKIKGLLTGTIAHDIKNYSAIIEANLRLSKIKELHEESNSHIQGILNSCRQIANISSNLIDINKIEENFMQTKNQLFDFKKIHNMILSLAESFNQQVSILNEFSDLTIESDKYLLERIFLNLFTLYQSSDNRAKNDKLELFFCLTPPISISEAPLVNKLSYLFIQFALKEIKGDTWIYENNNQSSLGITLNNKVFLKTNIPVL